MMPPFLLGDGSVEAIRAEHERERQLLGTEWQIRVNPYTFARVSVLLAEIDRLTGISTGAAASAQD